MAKIDEQTLQTFSEDPATAPDLVSERYVMHLAHLIMYNASFWRATVDIRHYDVGLTIVNMLRRFGRSPYNGIHCLANISKSQSWQVFNPKHWAPASVVYQTIEHYVQRCQDEEKAIFAGVPSQSLQFFFDLQDKIVTQIRKQMPCFSIDCCQLLIPKLALILHLLTMLDDGVSSRILNQLTIPAPEVSYRDQPHLTQLAWKFGILKRCIMEGRMEIRVFGVNTMQQDLVEVYQKYINNRQITPLHPIPNFLSDWMLANNLVEYLIGVESHPQLIQRSSNIVGFLVVAGRYSDAETDLIWRLLVSSQDPNKIDAILNMIQGFINVTNYAILLHLVRKLCDTPIQLFDGQLLVFSRNLFDSLRRQLRSMPAEHKMDIAPYRACVWLIRGSAADVPIDLNKRQEIQSWATDELKHLLAYGLTKSDLRDIYDECLSDIAQHTEHASGSILALHTLLKPKSEVDIKFLAQHSDLAVLLVNDIAHIASQSASKTAFILHECLTIRLALLMDLILLAPECITSDLAKNVWDVTVGSNAPNDQARNSAWSILDRVLASTKARNSFIDVCINDFVPTLAPDCIVHGSLLFARDVAQYDSRFQQSGEPTADEEQPERGSLRLLWQMSLAIPEGKHDLESKAINMLIHQYLDSPGTKKRSRAATDAVHVDLVERCISQLTSAAAQLKAFGDGTSSGEDEPMVIVASESDIEAQKLCFGRSMKILQTFVHGVRKCPMYSPEPQNPPLLPKTFHEIKGEAVRMMYQAFTDRQQTEIRTVEIGDLETGEDLNGRLKILTGFSHFQAFVGGQRLDLTKEVNTLIHGLKTNQKGLVLVRKTTPADSIPDLTPSSGLRPVEKQILSHFSELYELLALEESLARQVLSFLNAFPPHESITAMVCSLTTQPNEVFPPAAPFKILYSTHALRSCFVHHLDHGVPAQNLMSHSLEILTATMATLELNLSPSGGEVDLNVALALVECFLALVKEPTAFKDSTIPLSNPPLLVDRLQLWITGALDLIEASSVARSLIDECFAGLLETSLHSPSFLSSFVTATSFAGLLHRLLLQETRLELRQGLLKTLQNICPVSSKASTTPDNLMVFIWESIASGIPKSLEHVNCSQQFFEIANLVFRNLGPVSQDSLDLESYLHEWCGLLIRHSHTEFVGRNEVDWVAFGLSRLIGHLLHLAKSSSKQVQAPRGFMQALFHKHLFPDLSHFNDLQLDRPTRIPNLHTAVRGEMLMIIMSLSKDFDHYENLLEMVRDLVPQHDSSQAWSWGLAQIPDDYTWEPNYNFERSKAIRAPTGYPGLRNLSNTCYMNSLLTQLFMNIDFRRFMLNSRIADGDGSQRLLYQTRNLFGSLQNSFLKSVDTQGVAEAVITYDNTAIDVSIQMDVDEFYNLLFDRWESQILDDSDKRAFRGFYGGQIVQQIKSKQCEHISERLEPFSAIQCDINGKSTLMESLSAYVSGEVMEGDNKYSCTSCGSYVDAVKRACLKDIPDHLIFHLKRFDYDVMTGQRSKINSRFEFPREIDMAPYHVDSLKSPEEHGPPDVFELVGILVHSGSAESGHYYSYIQERPSTSIKGKTWVEFNDVDVNEFDPSNIDDQCFGGWADTPAYGNAFVKVWNAYMLFYERITPKAPKLRSGPTTEFNLPMKCDIPVDLKRAISYNNEMFLRQYCLFDPAQASFTRAILELFRTFNNGSCSRDHEIENDALSLVLEYLDRVQSRTKDCPNLERMLSLLTRTVGTCPQCSSKALNWLSTSESALRNLLLRCPLPRVRKDFAAMILVGLKFISETQPGAYGYVDENIASITGFGPMEPAGKVLPNVIDGLKELWAHLYMHSKSWDDYFGLLAELANRGRPEAHLMLSKGLLQKCLETLVVDTNIGRPYRNMDAFYQHYVRLLEKGRKFSIVKLVELTANLLSKITIQDEVYDGLLEHRPYDDGNICLASSEEELLCLGLRHPARGKDICIFLDKILNTGGNPQASKRIIQHILLSDVDVRLHTPFRTTIQNGISVDPAIHAAPYLRAALTFCECAISATAVEGLIRFIASEVESIGKSGGAEHLDFFVQARRLQNPRLNKPAKYFHRLVRRNVAQWAPTLLSYHEEGVRLATIHLLKVLLFTPDPTTEDDEEQEEEMLRAGKSLCLACARKGESQVQKQEPLEVPKAWEQLIEVTRECIKHFYQDEPEDHIQQIEGKHISHD